jgi:hypothetical protein
MSIRDCIIRAGEAGELTKAEVSELVKRHDELAGEHRLALGDAGATSDIARRMIEEQKAEKVLRQRRELLQLKASDMIRADLAKARSEGLPMSQAAILLLESYGEAPFKSAVGGQRAILSLARAKLEGLLNEFERHWLTGGTPNRALLDDVVREAHGQDTGSARAKALAQSWLTVAEDLRLRFNAAGGSIARLDSWGMSHSHDPAALFNAGFKAWKDFIAPRLDRAKMLHPLTGQAFTDAGFDGMLRRVYDRITTNGDVDLTPSRAPQGGSLATRHADHRFLQFKSADDWLAYDNAFGRGNAFAAMMDHVNTFSRDIALMERLGPNPASTIRWLQQVVDEDRAKGVVAGNGAVARLSGVGDSHLLGRVYEDVSGAAFVPVDARIAAGFSMLRGFHTATKLSGAVLSSVTDIGTNTLAREFAGLSGTPLVSAFADTIKALGPGDRQLALQAGLAVERALTVFNREASHLATFDGPMWSQWLADRTLGLSGLTAFTRAGREGFGLAFLRELAGHRGVEFRALPEKIRAGFERYGFDESLWNRYRQTPVKDGIIRPIDVEAAGEREAAEGLLSMVLMETEFAVPASVHRVRAGENMIGVETNAQRGTVGGELWRSMFQFKSYALMVSKLQAIRAGQVSAMTGERWKGGAYFAGFMLTATLLGGMAVQLKDMSRGKDPRDMSDWKFWMEAMFQGGGLGIMGDFVRSETNRFDNGLATTLAGPLAGSISQIVDATATPLLDMAKGKNPNVGRKVANVVSQNTPLLPFYLRTGYERAVIDRLRWAIDPQAARGFSDQVKRLRKEHNQEFFWSPGEAAPGRAPDMGAAFGP